jgi:hypothetical protein
MWVLAVVVVLGGCGRLLFDPLATDPAGDGGIGGDSSRDGVAGQVPAPVAWFALDENAGLAAYDSVTTTEWGLVQGGTWLAGHTGAALGFDGDGDNVGIGSLVTLANLPQVSVSAWINPATLADDGQPHCVFAKAETTTAGWAMLVDQNGDGSLGFESYYPTTTTMKHSLSGSLVVGQWQHVAATWDGDFSPTGIQLYRNGVAVIAGQFGGSSATRPDDATVSATINCYGIAGLAGVIDDVRIFDVVLTPQEVAELAAL